MALARTLTSPHRWRKLVACAQFTIQNSSPVSPVPLVLQVPPLSLVPQFKIQNSLLPPNKYTCDEYSPFIIPYKLERNPLNTPLINDFLPVLYCSESIDT